MLSDASTLLIIAAASCVVVPWLICRSFPVVENNSRAIQNDTRQFPDPSRGGTVRAFNDGE